MRSSAVLALSFLASNAAFAVEPPRDLSDDPMDEVAEAWWHDRVLAADDLDPQGIWNGTTAPTFTSVGALVALWNNGQGYEFCSGTLVNPRWFVTAAHCITAAEGDVANGATIYVFWNQDLYDENETAKYRKVTVMHRHTGYSDNASQIRDDIAVVQLASDAPVPTMGVLLDNPDTYKGEKLTYVGYGVTSSQQSDNDTSGIRRKTEMTLQGCVSPEYSYQSYPCGDVQQDPDYEPQFLYGKQSGTNICSGDSGGAAFRKMSNGTFLLVGVNSYTSGNCESGESGATRIDYYETWLEGKMGVQLVGTSTPPSDTGSDDTDLPDTGDDDDTGIDEPDDPAIPDTGLGDPETPPEGAYDRGFLGLCQVGPAAPTGAWLVGMLALVPLFRRKRR